MAWAGRGSTRAWRTLRARILARDPACQIQGPNCAYWSTEVDHITPVAEGGTDDDLRGVCGPCHAAKTVAEAARGRARARVRRRAERPSERHPGAL